MEAVAWATGKTAVPLEGWKVKLAEGLGVKLAEGLVRKPVDAHLVLLMVG